MGEYAEYLGDHIKIGTCESMYYLRYEDRWKVDPLEGNVNPKTEKNLFWRLPFPDEDKNGPGNYEPFRGELMSVEFAEFVHQFDPDPGRIQLKHECGLLHNVNCYHGQKLPEPTNEGKYFWNGKHAVFWELVFVKNQKDAPMRYVVQCRFCRGMYSFEWHEISPYIREGELKQRLERYSQ